MTKFTYIKDPAVIYAESFAKVRRAAALDHLPTDIAKLLARLIHACGMPDIIDDLHYSAGLITKGREALRAGKPIFCDCEMVASGVTQRFLPADNPVIVTLNDDRTAPLADGMKSTRSAAAVDLWDESLEGALVAIGNAPTALFRLLELIAVGGPVPAVILGFPVGFVGAAESKVALINNAKPTTGNLNGPEFIALTGTRGGSALAAAAINSLCLLSRVE